MKPLRDTVDRMHAVCTSARADAENAAAAGIDPDSGGGSTWSVPLSPTGAEPITHRGWSGRVTATMRTAYLARANSPHVQVFLESDGWTFVAAIASMGLQVVRQSP